MLFSCFPPRASVSLHVLCCASLFGIFCVHRCIQLGCTHSQACSGCLARLETMTFQLIFGICAINTTECLFDSRVMFAYLTDTREMSAHFWCFLNFKARSSGFKPSVENQLCPSWGWMEDGGREGGFDFVGFFFVSTWHSRWHMLTGWVRTQYGSDWPFKCLAIRREMAVTHAATPAGPVSVLSKNCSLADSEMWHRESSLP